MPLSSPRRKVSDTENKLRVLCCLDALGMATQEQLWPFVAQLELMEYMPFCMFVDELRLDGAIAAASHALEGALYLTGKGKEQLSLFSGKLLHADRERIRQEAPVYAARLSERRQLSAAYERAEAGEYCAALTVREGDVPTLFLRVTTADQALAASAVKGFRNCAAHVLTLLYTLPFGSCGQAVQAFTQQEALETAESGRCAVCEFGGREHAAAVCVSDGSARYTVLLLLPDAALACGWGAAAFAEGEALARRITALLTQAGEPDA